MVICVYKQFILKNKDIDILKFKIDDGIYGDYELTILETYNMSPSLYPIALKNGDPEALLEWLKQRNIPKNRAFVNEILGSLELTRNDLIGILTVDKGLSLNDSYWVVETDFKGEYKNYNLYDNAFNESIAEIAFTGRGINDAQHVKQHMLNGEGGSTTQKPVEVQTGTIHHEAVYETRYVVDAPTTTKQELTGYKCSSCGKTRSN